MQGANTVLSDKDSFWLLVFGLGKDKGRWER
jgi:hypothetical protein